MSGAKHSENSRRWLRTYSKNFRRWAGTRWRVACATSEQKLEEERTSADNVAMENPQVRGNGDAVTTVEVFSECSSDDDELQEKYGIAASDIAQFLDGMSKKELRSEAEKHEVAVSDIERFLDDEMPKEQFIKLVVGKIPGTLPADRRGSLQPKSKKELRNEAEQQSVAAADIERFRYDEMSQVFFCCYRRYDS